MATKKTAKAKAATKRKETKVIGPASSPPPVERARVLYADPPWKKRGKPFVAFRIDEEVLTAFDKAAKRAYPKSPNARVDMIRAFIFDTSGVGPELEEVES